MLHYCIYFFFSTQIKGLINHTFTHIDKNCNSMYLLSKLCLIKVLVLLSINSTIGVMLNSFNKCDILACNNILKIYLYIFLEAMCNLKCQDW